MLIGAMRQYFRGLKFILLIVIVAFVATSLVFVYGSGSLRGDGARGSAPATVNGEEIPAARLQRMQRNYLEYYRRAYRQDITPEMAERMGLTQQVISDLIQEALIIQQAKREGITVSDEELRLRIQSIPAFQEDGRFSRDRYLALLKQQRMEPGEFETEVRRDLLRQKMEALIKDGIKVSEAEVDQAYMTRFERVRADWAYVESGPLMAQVTVSDADAEAYVKAHEAQFSRPERRRIQYVLIAPKAFAKAVTDADAEAYYKEHRVEFEKPKRLKTAHILVRVPPTGGSEAENKSKAKVEEAIRRAKAGEDFGKLAKELSEDTATAPQGGDLGFVGKGEMVPQFEEAVFALKKGEMSPQPVRTPFGYHAIKVS
ncbi:MAG TPA: SurA N-terminal domain-containing protein, partial [Methylomirabilota bacterium]|nr:SurA N-terminal domain-containing protein [Methylomirabilota bacterium]